MNIENSAAGYESLANVLNKAYLQAATGKGKERHAVDRPFDQQPMQVISDLVGSADGLIYQAIKKAQESQRLPEGRDVAELLGAIVYLAGAIIYKEKQRGYFNYTVGNVDLSGVTITPTAPKTVETGIGGAKWGD
ncbi:hypothetical protein HNR62_000354 [Oceanisphaera litoralis]|uniref:hypothetical protein n=1 Tax=Oceanisphaera litoralis TaxID=225144 RepID=UPI00195CBAC2|nr:hypothetical protein [Oceanisphaera litoralis]MBM7454525.1 hypothetical protein [Oceanisphaera litoralis]